jgi:hypothetical protein
MRPVRFPFQIAIILLALSSGVSAAAIEAIPGKKYELSKANGPWMVFVATYHPTEAHGNEEAKTPEQAAKAAGDLVLELRQRGLPAYVYPVVAGEGTIQTFDKLGQTNVKKSLRKVEAFGVIAGNYDSIDDELAQKTLQYIKKLKPKCMDRESGMVWYAPKGEGPFHSAFLSANPLLTDEEIADYQARNKGVDKLLLQLNAGESYSLLENKGEYTVQVAIFTGRQVMLGGSASQTTRLPDDDVGEENPLDLAGKKARHLASALRDLRKIEAYVWHDHYRSIVTVGSYQSPRDVGAMETIELFRAKDKLNPKTNRIEPTPEIFWINGKGPDAGTSEIWAMMPTPVAIRVPRVKPRSSIARAGTSKIQRAKATK